MANIEAQGSETFAHFLPNIIYALDALWFLLHHMQSCQGSRGIRWRNTRRENQRAGSMFHIMDHIFIASDKLPKQTVQALRKAFLQLAGSAEGKLIITGAIALVLGLLPFLIAAPQMVAAHLDTLMTLPGWSSPYALIDGVIKHVDPKVADRFDLSLAASPIVPSQIPWGLVTLAFGAIYGLSEQRFAVGPTARAFLLIGLLGGFTTFSSFTFETFQLLRDGEYVLAGLNAAGQVCLGLFAFWLGVTAVRLV